MNWLQNVNIGDAARVAGAKELRPGVLASPWERGTCNHGKAYPLRWIWRKGESIESGEPEERNGCEDCYPPESEDT